MRGSWRLSHRDVKKRQDVARDHTACSGREVSRVMLSSGRAFVLLWQGQVVSQLGNQAFLIASTLYLLEVTGSATAVAATLIAATVPAVIVGPVGGSIADRHSRRRILVASDLLRALALGVLALVLLVRPDRVSIHVFLIMAVAGFNGTCNAVFAPAYQSLLPDLVPESRLAAANSMSQMSHQVATLVGQALGGAVYVSAGPVVLLLFDSASFAYAAGAAWLLPRDTRSRVASVGTWRAIRRHVSDARQGLVYLRRRRGLTALLGIFAGVNLLFMPVLVLLPFYARGVLRAGPEWYGLLLGGLGAGALMGSVSAGAVLTRARTRSTLVRLAIAGVAGGVLGLAISRAPWQAIGALAGVGAFSSLINVAVITAVQRGVSADVRGRVMAIVIAVSTAAVPVGMGLGGVFGELWPESLPQIFAGCGLAMAALAVFCARVSGLPALLDGRDPPAASSGPASP